MTTLTIGSSFCRIWIVALVICGTVACADREQRASHSANQVDDPHQGAASGPEQTPVLPHTSAGIQSPDVSGADADRVRYIQRALKPPSEAALNGRRITRTATGFFISDHEIITNYHAVAGCSRLSKQSYPSDAPPTLVALTATDQIHDLALLNSTSSAPNPAIFERSLDRVDGSDLSIVGFPSIGLPRQQAIVSTAVAVPSEFETGQALYRLNADVHPGNSGSPILDEYGAVVGVVARRIDTVAVYRKTGALITDVAFAIPNSIVEPFLEKHHARFRKDEPPVSLTPADRLAKSRGFVVRIDCWD